MAKLREITKVKDSKVYSLDLHKNFRTVTVILMGFMVFLLSFSVAQAQLLYFNAVNDFSNVQGYKNWYYMYNFGTPMSYGTNWWGGLLGMTQKGVVA